MRLFLSILLLLSLAMNAQAEIYKWIDQKGNVHFSDSPHPGASQVILPAAQMQDPVTAPNPPAATNNPPTATNNPPSVSSPPTVTVTSPPPVLAHTYQKLDITAPLDQASIFNGPGEFTVTVNVVPSIMKGDKLQVLLDGKMTGESNGNSVTLTPVDRGTHQVQAQIVDASNKTLISSKTITVFVHRASLLNALNKKP
jgi:hypothetical protein